MTYGELKRRLRGARVRFLKQAKGHEIWINPANGRRTLVGRHRGEVPSGTLHSILRQLGLRLEDLN